MCPGCVPEVVWTIHSFQGGLCSALNTASVQSAISIAADLEAATLIDQVTPQGLGLGRPLLPCHALNCAFVPASRHPSMWACTEFDSAERDMTLFVAYGVAVSSQLQSLTKSFLLHIVSL